MAIFKNNVEIILFIHVTIYPICQVIQSQKQIYNIYNDN